MITHETQNMSVDATMQGKPVLERIAKTVLTIPSLPFKEKMLCDGITLNLGDACVYSCSYCYVPPQIRKYLHSYLNGRDHTQTVVRRADALEILRNQLTTGQGEPRYPSLNDTRVVYSSTLVDIAANTELMEETAEACKIIFSLTNWQIRLLTKSHLLPKLVEKIPEQWHHRMILGVSTGTFDEKIAQAIEQGAPLIRKRVESLHWLQDRGFRTFAMICPSLPQDDYISFARNAAETLRIEKCEDVWAEVINVRGPNFIKTHALLIEAGLHGPADALAAVSIQECDKIKLSQVNLKRQAWEDYARATFLAHCRFVPQNKLKFLQYVTDSSKEWWKAHEDKGAVLLGSSAHT